MADIGTSDEEWRGPRSGAVAAVVFDLGGVLAEFGGVERMTALAGARSDDEMWRRWLTCEWVRRFERGRCDPRDFAAGVVEDWALEIGAEQFLDEFATWLIGPFPGAEELVAETQARVPVGCLSNTNAVHWEAGAGQWPLMELFDHTFLSFEIGMVKPDPEIFGHVVEALDLPPARVLFLDDNRLNVDAARAAGLAAERVQGVAQARAALAAAGVVAGRVASSPAAP